MLKETPKREQVINKALILTESEADRALIFLAGMEARRTIEEAKGTKETEHKTSA